MILFAIGSDGRVGSLSEPIPSLRMRKTMEFGNRSNVPQHFGR